MWQDGETVKTTSNLELVPSVRFAEWLDGQDLSLAFTTYQAGKVFLVGTRADTQTLSVFERTFARSMGFAATDDGQTLWLASQFQLWRFTNFLSRETASADFDAMYVPIEGRTVGEVDIHDIHPSPGRGTVVHRFAIQLHCNVG